jgi:hypothetical protein
MRPRDVRQAARDITKDLDYRLRENLRRRQVEGRRVPTEFKEIRAARVNVARNAYKMVSAEHGRFHPTAVSLGLRTGRLAVLAALSNLLPTALTRRFPSRRSERSLYDEGGAGLRQSQFRGGQSQSQGGQFRSQGGPSRSAAQGRQSPEARSPSAEAGPVVSGEWQPGNAPPKEWRDIDGPKEFRRKGQWAAAAALLINSDDRLKEWYKHDPNSMNRVRDYVSTAEEWSPEPQAPATEYEYAQSRYGDRPDSPTSTVDDRPVDANGSAVDLSSARYTGESVVDPALARFDFGFPAQEQSSGVPVEPGQAFSTDVAQPLEYQATGAAEVVNNPFRGLGSPVPSDLPGQQQPAGQNVSGGAVFGGQPETRRAPAGTATDQPVVAPGRVNPFAQAAQADQVAPGSPRAGAQSPVSVGSPYGPPSRSPVSTRPSTPRARR